MAKVSQWDVEIDTYSFALALLHGVVALVALVQICRIVAFRHAVLHFQFGFLSLLLAWSILRGVFWIFMPWPAEPEVIMQGAALLLQFTTFALLALFYAQMIYKSTMQWSTLRRRAMITFVAINMLFLGGFSGTVVAGSQRGFDDGLVQEIDIYFVSFLFLVLAVVLAVFGWRLLVLLSVDNLKIPFLKSKIQISVLTVTLCFVFVSRSVKDFLAGLGIFAYALLDPETQPIMYQVIMLSQYLFWENIPAAMMLIFFWHIPGRSRQPAAAVPAPYFADNPGSVQSPAEHRINIKPSNSPLLSSKSNPSQIFNNPHRYESDDELISPLRTPQNDEGKRQARFAPVYGGYNTRSPLLDRNDKMGTSPINNTNVNQ